MDEIGCPPDRTRGASPAIRSLLVVAACKPGRSGTEVVSTSSTTGRQLDHRSAAGSLPVADVYGGLLGRGRGAVDADVLGDQLGLVVLD